MIAWPLVAAALALGLAASPHCVLMCSAPCAAVTGGNPRRAAGLLAGRVVGYGCGGAVAAASVQAIGAWSQAAPVLRPLWMLLHLGLLALGGWWLATGRPLAAMDRGAALPLTEAISAATTGVISVPVRLVGIGTPAPACIAQRGPLLRAGLAGLAWVLWPCGALHAALLLAALANDAAGGALVMAAFALASMPALALAPWAWARWRAAWPGGPARALPAGSALGWRAAGAALLLGSGAALGQGQWHRFAAWCGV